MAYVYRHIRLDTLTPFYIGVGSDNEGKFSRANIKGYTRNRHWQSIVNKYGYRVDIILDDLSWKDALDKEIEFIQIYGRVNSGTGILCNRTDGGEGFVGVVYTDEMRHNMSLASRLPSRIIASNENLKKAQEKLKNETTLEKKERFLKIATSLKGGKRTDEQRDNISKSLKGKSKSKEHIEKSKASIKKLRDLGMIRYTPIPKEKLRKKGEFSHSEESKRKISEANKKRKATPETKLKMSASHKNFKHTPETIARMKKIHIELGKNKKSYRILAYKLQGMVLLGDFRNTRDVAEALKISTVSVCKILNKKRESISGFTFIREDFMS